MGPKVLVIGSEVLIVNERPLSEGELTFGFGHRKTKLLLGRFLDEVVPFSQRKRQLQVAQALRKKFNGRVMQTNVSEGGLPECS